MLQVTPGDGQEVSSFVCPSRYLLVAGWSRVVRVYSDLPGHDHKDPAGGGGGGAVALDCGGCSDQWEAEHSEDIMCMALLRPTTVVTGSYDGDLVVWSLDNGRMLVRFNADLSTGPLRSKSKSRPPPPARRKSYVLLSVERILFYTACRF